MKCLVFFFITWGLAMSFPLENGRGTKELAERDLPYRNPLTIGERLKRTFEPRVVNPQHTKRGLLGFTFAPNFQGLSGIFKPPSINLGGVKFGANTQTGHGSTINQAGANINQGLSGGYCPCAQGNAGERLKRTFEPRVINPQHTKRGLLGFTFAPNFQGLSGIFKPPSINLGGIKFNANTQTGQGGNINQAGNNINQGFSGGYCPCAQGNAAGNVAFGGNNQYGGGGLINQAGQNINQGVQPYP